MEWDRNLYAKDLEKLAEIINRYDSDEIFKNLGTNLYKAAYKIQYSTDNLISVHVGEIEIVLKKAMSGSIPSKVDSLTICFESCCEFDMSVDINVNDRITDSFNFQIELIGINESGEYFNSWHLDKDIRTPGAGSPKVSHPLYHFQSGGHKLETKNISGAIFLSAPRLPHPPMDVVLGLHFILNNFCSKKDYSFLGSIFDDYDYGVLMDRARNRMLLPYFRAFESNNSHQDFIIENVFPLAKL